MIFRYLFTIALVGSFFIACKHKETVLPVKQNFNKDWKFHLLESEQDEMDFVSENFDDSSWTSVHLPHTARIEPLLVNDQWQGICWYRKTFDISFEAESKELWLELEGAMNVSKVWINDSLVVEHSGGYLPVVVDIGPFVKKGENLIAVRLDNRDNPLTGPKPLEILDFNMYGGLYRNAWLLIKNKIHFTHPVLGESKTGGGLIVSYPQVTEKEAIISINAHVENTDFSRIENFEILYHLYEGDKLIHSSKSGYHSLDPGLANNFMHELTLSNPKLWSPKDPFLYRIEAVIMKGKEQYDKLDYKIGIRRFTFEYNKLFVNGEETFLRGVNRHQEYPFIGYALSDNAQYRDAKKIKDAGFNCIRLSHYPHSPAFMDACDELGIIVLDAILGWQYYLEDDRFKNYCYQSAKDLVLRDRNHPCVLAWEVSLNESWMPLEFMQNLDSIVHQYLPGNYVYTCGWQNDVYDIYLQARQHRIGGHYDSIQAKPYFVSEYGDWEYYAQDPGLNQHMLPRELRIEKSSRQKRGYGEKRLLQQAFNVQEAHNDNYNTPAFGDGYWVMFDYNRGYHDDVEASGLMDIFRIPKFSYYFFQSQKSIEKDTILYIASYWNENSSTDVRIFSNAEEVELMLNGKSIGRQSPDQNENTKNLKHPPFTFHIGQFEPGILEAIAYKDNQILTKNYVETPGNASYFMIELDESGRPAKSGVKDAIFAYIKVVDEKGNIVPDFNDIIQVELKGDATLMNPDEIKAEAGIATILLLVGNSTGDIEITALHKNIAKTKKNFVIGE